jgi:hypothetical protein
MDKMNLGEPIDAADAAARWWTLAAGQPVRHSTRGGLIEPGDDPFKIGFLVYTDALADGREPRPDVEPAAKFHHLLSKLIRVRLARQRGWSTRPFGVTLGVDYGPDEELYRPALEAGFPTGRFPWKTSMWVYDDHVVVSAGYQAPTRFVWTASSYEPRPCHAQEYEMTSQEYKMLPRRCGLWRYHDGDHRYTQESPLCVECDQPEAGGRHREGDYRYHEFVPAAAK